MKNLFAGLSLMLACGAFAAECYDTTVYVWTNGPDKYADGNTVLDGERYALCWSEGVFAGFKADGTPVNDADEVIGIASLAKGGKCRDFIFSVTDPALATAKADAPTSKYTSGNFSLWLLDTRVYSTNGIVSFAAQESPTKVSAIAGAADVGATIKVQSSSAIVNGDAGEVVTAASAVPADAPAPAIKSFKIDNGYAIIEVENTVPYLTYDLTAGDKPDAMSKGQAAHPVSGAATKAETITLIKKVEAGGEFFKVERK